MFSKEANTTTPCEFNLIEVLDNKKELSIVDNFFYIKDYKCAYGFSDNIYNTYPQLQKDVDIKNFVLEKAKILYYLIIDARLLSVEELKERTNQTTKLDIKPKFVSIITSTQQNTKTIISSMQKIFEKTNIDWKVHSFLNTMSFNECINITAETTINNLENIQYMIFDDGNESSLCLNDVVNHSQYVFKIIQDNVYCIMSNKDSLHMTSMYISLYKSIVSTIGRDIVTGIHSIPNLNIGLYDIEKSK